MIENFTNKYSVDYVKQVLESKGFIEIRTFHANGDPDKHHRFFAKNTNKKKMFYKLFLSYYFKL